MRKTGLLSAALLLATSGIALNVHAQESQSTTTPSRQTANPGTTTRSTTETTTTTTRGADANAASQSATGVNTSGQIEAFTGKITKKNNQFMLEDKDKSANYKLDDASKADHYDGKNVKVMGTLDPSTNMIHVQAIEEEKGSKNKS